MLLPVYNKLRPTETIRLRIVKKNLEFFNNLKFKENLKTNLYFIIVLFFFNIYYLIIYLFFFFSLAIKQLLKILLNIRLIFFLNCNFHES